MNITIKLFGTYRNIISDYDPESGITMEVEEAILIKDLIQLLGLSDRKIGLISVNGRKVKTHHQIENGDQISFFQPFSGG